MPDRGGRVPDPVDEVLRHLRGQQPPAAFASAEAVRRRGRQRTRRRALAAGAAAVCVLGVAAGVGWPLVTDDDQTATIVPATVAPPTAPLVTPTGSPATGTPTTGTPNQQGTAVPPGALLTPADLGPGEWHDYGAEPFEGGGDTWLWAQACEGYDRSAYPGLAKQRDWKIIGYARGEPEAMVTHMVEQYAPGAGGQALADVRNIIEWCKGRAAYNAEQSGAGPTRNDVVMTGFAGDESMLVRQRAYFYEGETLRENPRVYYAAVVRNGDRVATLLCAGLDAGEVRALAIEAATLL